MSMRPRAAVALLLSIAAAGGPLASDAPDAEVNPATGDIESVGTEMVGTDLDLRHTVDPGQGAPVETVLLTTSPQNDLRPRMAITPEGKTWIVWWRDASTDAVLCRERDGTGVWQTERMVSLPGENSRDPEIAAFGGHLWLAYEVEVTGGTGITVVEIDDTPDPFGRLALATSELADPDVQIHSVGGHLWVTWIHSAAIVGWAELDASSQTWLPVEFESYTSGGLGDARSRIRAQVLAP